MTSGCEDIPQKPLRIISEPTVVHVPVSVGIFGIFTVGLKLFVTKCLQTWCNQSTFTFLDFAVLEKSNIACGNETSKIFGHIKEEDNMQSSKS